MSVTAYIGLGSNLAGSLESPQAQIKQALVALAALPQSTLLAQSALYRSQPLPTQTPINQADYINAVAALDTRLTPGKLLAVLQAIEQDHKRVRGEKWGPRTLDLDILLYGNRVLDTGVLQIPHPGLTGRAFVLYPLAEIAPELAIPGHGTVTQLLATCPRGDLCRIEPNQRREIEKK